MTVLKASIGYRPSEEDAASSFIVGLGAAVEPPSSEAEFPAVDTDDIEGKWLRLTLVQKGDGGDKVLAESMAFRFASASGVVISLPVLIDNGHELIPSLRLTEQDRFRDGKELGVVEFAALPDGDPAPPPAPPILAASADLIAPGAGARKTYQLSITSTQDGFSLMRRFDGQKQSAKLPIALYSLHSALAKQRAELNRESKAYEKKYRDPDAGPLTLRRDHEGDDLAVAVTHRLAEIGSKLYKEVLRRQIRKDTSRKEILAELRDADYVREGTPLEIENDKLVLPWNLIYDRDVPKLEDFGQEDLKGFWGYRFRIYEPLEGGGHGRQPPEKRLCAYVDPTLGLGAQKSKPLEEISKDHREWLSQQDALPPDCTIHLVPENAAAVNDPNFMEQIGEELGKAESRHLLYFFCHGSGAATFDNNNFVGVEGGLKLTKEEEHSLSNVTLDAWADAETWNEEHDTEAVVFFNCCESAELDPFGVTGIVDAFEYHLAPAAIVACNWEVPGRFAFEFAQRFLSTYLEGETEGIGEVIFQLRRELLRQFNPFGLVYSVYGKPSVNVS